MKRDAKEFVERMGEKLRITKREKHYLLTSAFTSEPWVELDDAFWLGQLKLWREHLKNQDASQ